MSLRKSRLALISAAMLLISACAGGPAYTSPASERFASKTVRAERVAIIANMPPEHIKTIAVPVASQLTAAFRQSGFHVNDEVQVTSPLALGPEVSFAGARQFKPHAYLIIKFAGSSTGSAYTSYWNLRFELLNEQGQGVWRGAATLLRLDDMNKTSEQIAREVLGTLLKDQVIEIRPKGEGV